MWCILLSLGPPICIPHCHIILILLEKPLVARQTEKSWLTRKFSFGYKINRTLDSWTWEFDGLTASAHFEFFSTVSPGGRTAFSSCVRGSDRGSGADLGLLSSDGRARVARVWQRDCGCIGRRSRWVVAAMDATQPPTLSGWIWLAVVLLVLSAPRGRPGQLPWAWRWWSSPPSEVVGPRLDWRVSRSII
jgi:hypothetical protein